MNVRSALVATIGAALLCGCAITPRVQVFSPGPSIYDSDEEYQGLMRYLEPSAFYPDGNSGQLQLLIMAVDRGDMAVLRRLFIAAPKLSTVREGGSRCSPIHWAAFKGDTNILSLLIEQGEDINRRGTWSDITPLHLVRDARTAKLLIHSKADIEALDNQGQTPLMWAAERGKSGVAESLIAAGSKIDHEDHSGATALSLATFHKHDALVELLLRSGAKPLSNPARSNPGLQARMNAGAPEGTHPFSSWTLIFGKPTRWEKLP